MMGLILSDDRFFGCDGGVTPDNAKTLFLRPDGTAKLLSWSALSIQGSCVGECGLCDVTANYLIRKEEAMP